MEPFMEHTIPVAWSDIGGMNKGPWAFHEGSSFMPEMMECAGGVPIAHESSCSPSHAFVQHMKPHGPMHIFEDSPDSAVPAPALNQEVYAAMRGVPAGMTPIPNMQEPFQCTTNPLITSTTPPLPPQTAFPTFPRGYGRDRSNTPRTWCQSFINGPRERTMPSDRDSPGETSQDEVDGRNRNYDVQFCGSSGAIHLGLPPMQADGLQHPQLQGDQVYMPLFETHSGVAQHQGPASMVTGAARPRVRARRGQATDPHSIAERLRRERIAERMKALQELVPNANKTDKASMLDEIIDYVKFLQLQVKVLSMSRLGGTGAVAPFMTDFPTEGQSSLAAALGPMPSFHDTMVIAERQVARLMEEDMGSAMQFLQAKGLCLMPVSLAGVVSSNDSRMVANTGGGGGQQQAVSAILDQSRMHAASSSTTSTLASVASSSCAGGEGDSKSKQQ